MIRAVISLILFSGVSAQADFTVLDPKGELSRFAQDLNMGTFDEEMTCRQTETYFSENTHTKYNCNPQ